jgi:hypothetical protein
LKLPGWMSYGQSVGIGHQLESYFDSRIYHARKSSRHTTELMLTYAVHVLLELLDRLVQDRRYPVVNEKGVYNGTCADVSRRRGR